MASRGFRNWFKDRFDDSFDWDWDEDREDDDRSNRHRRDRDDENDRPSRGRNDDDDDGGSDNDDEGGSDNDDDGGSDNDDESGPITIRVTTTEDEAIVFDSLSLSGLNDDDDELGLASVNQSPDGGAITALAGGLIEFDPSGDFDFLKNGETTIAVFTGFIGEHDDEEFDDLVPVRFEVEITGVSEPAVITDADLTGAVVEDADNPTLVDRGTIGFTDADLADSHVASAAFTSTTHTGQLGALTADVTQDTTGTGTDGVVTWTYKVTNSGVQFLGRDETITETYTVTIADDQGDSVSQDLVVTITGVNDEVVVGLADLEGTVVEDATEPTLTDSGTIGFSDADLADAHAASASFKTSTHGNSPLGTMAALVTADTTGTGTGGLVTWTYEVSNAAVQFLGQGETITETHTVTLTDNQGHSVSQDIDVTITGVNDDPVASDDTVISDEDFVVTIDALANDSDVDGDTLGIIATTDPANGTLSINPDNTINYTPNANFNGSDSFTYTISDGNGAADVAVLVIVNPVNDTPVASDDTVISDEDFVVTIDALANDSDVDGDTLGIIATTAPANGTLSINPDNTIDYTPNANFNGSDSFTYTISDGNGAADVATVSLVVRPVNDIPEASDDTVIIDEDFVVTIAPLANDSDADGDTLSIVGTTEPANGTVTVNPDNTVTYLPDANFNGSDIFRYSISDGNGGIATAAVLVIVNPVNDTPVASDDTVISDEDFVVTIDALANDSDVDGDTLGIIATTAPANGTLSINPDNTINYTPNANFNGSDSFRYTISDGNGAIDVATVSLVVRPVNDIPEASDDTVIIDEDFVVTIAPLANDSDADGDTLSIVGTTEPANGTVTVNPDNTVTYLPDANFNGSDIFRYSISDGNGGIATAAVLVIVNPVNDTPVASDDTVISDEDFVVTIDALANDSDVDGDTLSIVGTTDPANGTVTVNPDNTINYTPNANFNGSDSFTYTISDGNGAADVATVSLVVRPVNDIPEASDDTVIIDEDFVVTIAPLANDSDADGDTLSIVGTTEPANGTVTVNPDNTVTYLPDANFNGSDIFRYSISDGNGGIATAAVLVIVNPVNDTPVASDDTVISDEDFVVTIDALANDSDVDGDTLGIIATTAPANGTLSINPDNTIDYTPNANFNGSDSFTYTISDGNGAADVATVSLVVRPVNDIPEASDDTVIIDEDFVVTIAPLANDSDADGDTLSIVGTTEPANGTVTVNPDNTVTYLPDANFNGSDSFRYSISDGNGGIATAAVLVIVNPVNDTPVASDDSVITSEDFVVTIDALANDSDVDGDTLGIIATTAPANGTLSINPDNTIDYTPNANFNGSDSFTYTISDGNGGIATAAVLVIVNPVNDTPVATDDTVISDEDFVVTIDALANDTDADGDTLGIIATTAPANGTLSINPDNTINYTPNANFNGSDSFTYTISDGNGAADVATVNVVVSPVNDIPVASDDTTSTQQGTAVTINVLANDSDPDGDPLSITGTGPAANGTVAINPDNTVTYTPNAGFVGNDTFTYDISDGNGGVDSASVTVSVSASQGGGGGGASDPPVSGSVGDDLVFVMRIANLEGDSQFNRFENWFVLDDFVFGAGYEGSAGGVGGDRPGRAVFDELTVNFASQYGDYHLIDESVAKGQVFNGPVELVGLTIDDVGRTEEALRLDFSGGGGSVVGTAAQFKGGADGIDRTASFGFTAVRIEIDPLLALGPDVTDFNLITQIAAQQSDPDTVALLGDSPQGAAVKYAMRYSEGGEDVLVFIDGFEFGLSNTANLTGGPGGGGNRVRFDEVTVTGELDALSALLADRTADGKSARIDLEAGSQLVAGTTAIADYAFEGARITEFDLSAGADRLTFVFDAYAEFQPNEPAPDGSNTGDRGTFGWDIPSNMETTSISDLDPSPSDPPVSGSVGDDLVFVMRIANLEGDSQFNRFENWFVLDDFVFGAGYEGSTGGVGGGQSGRAVFDELTVNFASQYGDYHLIDESVAKGQVFNGPVELVGLTIDDVGRTEEALRLDFSGSGGSVVGTAAQFKGGADGIDRTASFGFTAVRIEIDPLLALGPDVTDFNLITQIAAQQSDPDTVALLGDSPQGAAVKYAMRYSEGGEDVLVFIDGFEFGLSNTANLTGGPGGGGNRVRFDEVTVTGELDALSALLADRTADGKSARIDLEAGSQLVAGTTAIADYAFEGARITEFDLSAGADRLTFVFDAYAEFQPNEPAPDGSNTGDRGTFGWDIPSNMETTSISDLDPSPSDPPVSGSVGDDLVFVMRIANLEGDSQFNRFENWFVLDDFVFGAGYEGSTGGVGGDRPGRAVFDELTVNFASQYGDYHLIDESVAKGQVFNGPVELVGLTIDDVGRTEEALRLDFSGSGGSVVGTAAQFKGGADGIDRTASFGFTAVRIEIDPLLALGPDVTDFNLITQIAAQQSDPDTVALLGDSPQGAAVKYAMRYSEGGEDVLVFIDGFEFGLSNTANLTGGPGGGGNRVRFDEVTVTGELDALSALLADRTADGKSARIDLEAGSQSVAGTTAIADYAFEGARITEFDLSAGADRLTFVFDAYVEFQPNEPAPDGSNTGDRGTFGWDVPSNMETSINDFEIFNF